MSDINIESKHIDTSDTNKKFETITWPAASFSIQKPAPEYKWNEDRHLKEVLEYINTTYSQHYAQGKIQTTEVIVDSGHGMGFMIGNILKYTMRLGKKDGFNKKDLLKAVHYAVMALEIHERESTKKKR